MELLQDAISTQDPLASSPTDELRLSTKIWLEEKTLDNLRKPILAGGPTASEYRNLQNKLKQATEKLREQENLIKSLKSGFVYDKIHRFSQIYL